MVCPPEKCCDCRVVLAKSPMMRRKHFRRDPKPTLFGRNLRRPAPGNRLVPESHGPVPPALQPGDGVVV